MGLLSWLVVGWIAGLLAGFVIHSRGNAPVGVVVVGMIGGLVGGYIAGALFGGQDTLNGINAVSIVLSFLSATFMIGVSRLVLNPKLA